MGVELAGATRHGELQRGAQKEEEEVGNTTLTMVAVRREAMAGDEVICGGDVRLVVTKELRRDSGVEEARTA